MKSISPEDQTMEFQVKAVFRAAAASGKALEINAMPDRLDLKDLHAYRARELGVMLAICTDSHATWHLNMMRFGVGVARRAWCQPKDILNTLPLKDMLEFLRRGP